MIYRESLLEPGDLVAGVDTHADTHTVAVLTGQGVVTATRTFSADRAGYQGMIAMLGEVGHVSAAAVISMAVLRRFSGSSVQENNIIQTVASAAGTLAAIIFVLPGLIIVGWWQDFPYWITVAICMIGGALGVMYTVPLRRALVTGSDLPYPEGLAAAEVLKVGSKASAESDADSVHLIVWGTIISAAFGILTKLKVLSDSLSAAVRIGSGGLAGSASLSMALIGIGHLVGLSVGIAMFVGLAIGWAVLVPIMTWGKVGAGSDVADVVNTTFTNDVRFVGAGTMAIAAIWALVKILGPIVRGIKDAAVSSRARRSGQSVELQEQDLPITIVAGWIVLSLLPIAALLWWFLQETHLRGNETAIIVVTLLFTVVIGALVAAVCGYMAGLIGSSNSPSPGSAFWWRCCCRWSSWFWSAAAVTRSASRSWWPTRCSPPRSFSPSPPSPTTTCKT